MTRDDLVTDGPELDLSYDDPPPPADFAARVERSGRVLRRRRRVGASVVVAAGVAIAVAAATQGAALFAGPAPVVPAPPTEQLPPAHAHARAEFTYPDGATQYAYIDPHPTNGVEGPEICFGELPQPHQVTASCASPPALFEPDQKDGETADYGADFAVEVPGHPTPGRHRVLVGGRSKGPVTRVDVRVNGKTVRAALARDTDPAIGTFWIAGTYLESVGSDPEIDWTVWSGSKVLARCSNGNPCSSL